ncbi:MAG: PQQ-binding-like beta-propeller repeat protein [Planctomycetota bacterium]
MRFRKMHFRKTTPPNVATRLPRRVILTAAFACLLTSPSGAQDDQGKSSVHVKPSHASPPAKQGHWILLGAQGRLVLTDPAGKIRWEMPWNNIHDLHWTDAGEILTRRGKYEVVRINPVTKQVTWSVDVRKLSNRPVELHAFEPLANGRTMVALSGAAKIIEINDDGSIAHAFSLTTQTPSLHSDTRLVRADVGGGDPSQSDPSQSDSGPAGYWVAHEKDGAVRRYDHEGTVIWEYTVPLFGRPRASGHGPEAFGNQVFSAIPDGTGGVWLGTGNGHSVLRVSPEKKILWQLGQDDLPGIRLAWVTNVHPTNEGTILIGNCHAGPGQPIVVEVDLKTRQAVWQLAGFKRFGNNVSNTLPLTAPQAARLVGN